jgi:hypothetical protein
LRLPDTTYFASRSRLAASSAAATMP